MRGLFRDGGLLRLYRGYTPRLVTVVLNGKGEMRRLKIDLSLVKPEDAEILEDLIVAAHNDAKSKIEMRVQEETQRLMGGLPLPPGMKFPF